ncbi:MAG TPA: PaaI family thioesterase [Gaiellaceae bacterium]
MSRRRTWGESPPPPPHVWHTLGYRYAGSGDGTAAVEWDASEDYSFADGSGPIVHGGLVATLLDTAMGGACWTTMEPDESFLTADLRVEFLRSARPGTLRAEGRVVHRTRRVVFCEAELRDGDGTLLAAGRCTQIVRRS